MLPVVDYVAGHRVDERIGPSTKMLSALEDNDVGSPFGQLNRSSQAGEPASDYYYSFAQVDCCPLV
jgi:hypothetical protein